MYHRLNLLSCGRLDGCGDDPWIPQVFRHSASDSLSSMVEEAPTELPASHDVVIHETA